jgi:N-acetylmuramoyl-L-alanine amidase
MDPGARGKYGIVEKHLVLDYAKRIAKEINKQQGFKAVLTRTKDVYLTLERRTEIAQRYGADIFVSIHLNWAQNRRARGTEIWFLSPAGAAAKASKLMSDKRDAESELGLDKGHSEELLSLILDTNQQAMMHRSSLLAEEILKAMQKRGFPPSRGVRQKAWAVCTTVAMPSVLIETGFISNAQDAKFLNSKEGRDEVSKAIAAGIISFLKRYPPPSSVGRDVIVHKVKKGETLWRISKLYGSSVATIRKVNGIGKSSTLYPGQELLITN